MPGSIPATSQLDWLISTTAMIVLSWSKATRDLLKSFGWGIGALHQLDAQRRWCHFLAACPIASHGPINEPTPALIGTGRPHQLVRGQEEQTRELEVLVGCRRKKVHTAP